MEILFNDVARQRRTLQNMQKTIQEETRRLHAQKARLREEEVEYYKIQKELLCALTTSISEAAPNNKCTIMHLGRSIDIRELIQVKNYEYNPHELEFDIFILSTRSSDILSKRCFHSGGYNLQEPRNIGDDAVGPYTMHVRNNLADSIVLGSNRSENIVIPANETRCTHTMKIFILYYTSGWNTTGISGLCNATNTYDGRIGMLCLRDSLSKHDGATNPYELSNCGDDTYYTFSYNMEKKEYEIAKRDVWVSSGPPSP